MSGKMLPLDAARLKITFNYDYASFSADEEVSIAEKFTKGMTREQFAQLCANVTGRKMVIYGRSKIVGGYDQEIPTIIAEFDSEK